MRKLATIQKIESIKKHSNADNLEIAKIKGWDVVVKKGNFLEGQFVIFFEIDSLLPILPQFDFLKKNGTKKVQIMGELANPNFEVEGYRLKTVKLRGQISSGLIMKIEDFFKITEKNGDKYINIDE